MVECKNQILKAIPSALGWNSFKKNRAWVRVVRGYCHFKELRENLRSHDFNFATESDTEGIHSKCYRSQIKAYQIYEEGRGPVQARKTKVIHTAQTILLCYNSFFAI